MECEKLTASRGPGALRRSGRGKNTQIYALFSSHVFFSFNQRVRLLKQTHARYKPNCTEEQSDCHFLHVSLLTPASFCVNQNDTNLIGHLLYSRHDVTCDKNTSAGTFSYCGPICG